MAGLFSEATSTPKRCTRNRRQGRSIYGGALFAYTRSATLAASFAGRTSHVFPGPRRPEKGGAWIISLNKPEIRTLLMNVPESPVFVPGSGKTDYLFMAARNGTGCASTRPCNVQINWPGCDSGRSCRLRWYRGADLRDRIEAGPLDLQRSSTPDPVHLVRSHRPHSWDGGAPGPYHFGPFRISPDGRTVAASLDEPGWPRMGLLEIERGIFNALPPEGNDSFPAWAPKSTRLAYGRVAIDLVQSITPDGKLDGPPRVFSDGWEARFSPDGRWVAFSSNESGADEIYVDAFPNPRRKFVSRQREANFRCGVPTAGRLITLRRATS